jgi:dihydroorotate dehydrogenase (fumarate)
VNLTTNYLGLTLAHPLMPGASPMVADLDAVRRLEDAGASAIVMHSLFAEQVEAEQLAAQRHIHGLGGFNAEAPGWFPAAGVFALGVDAYLEQIRKIREAVAVPVIASLNGASPGPWLDWARRFEEAGAHAIELNLYALATDPAVEAGHVEAMQCTVVEAVTSSVTVPVAVKLSPYYSSLPAFLRAIEGAGAKGAVLFNRFYQPDIDPETLSLSRALHLSDASELPLRLRWLAVASPRTSLSLACSGGVHAPIDVVKALMAGAHAVQSVSALLERGPSHLRVLLEGLRAWMEAHEYARIDDLRGSMNHARCPDPSAYERANYVKLLQGWHPGEG